MTLLEANTGWNGRRYTDILGMQGSCAQINENKNKISDWSNNNRYSVTLFSLLFLFVFFLLLLFIKSLCKPKNKDKRDVKKGPRWIWSWNSRLHPCGSTHSTRPSCNVRITASLRDAQWSTDVQLNPVFLPARYEFFWNLCFYACEKSYQTLGKFSFLYSESSEL